MYLDILRHYNVSSACYNKSIVFDDQTENLASAHSIGLQTVQAYSPGLSRVRGVLLRQRLRHPFLRLFSDFKNGVKKITLAASF